MTGSPRSTWAPGTFRLRFAKLAPSEEEEEANAEAERGASQFTGGQGGPGGPARGGRMSRPSAGIKLIPLNTMALRRGFGG